MQCKNQCGVCVLCSGPDNLEGLSREYLKELVKLLRRRTDQIAAQIAPLLRQRSRMREEIEERTRQLEDTTRQLEKALVENKTLKKQPQEFYCPITHAVMKNPVFAVDGYTYEREAIERWFSYYDTSPITNEVLSSNKLTPNWNLRSQIASWNDAH